MEDQPKKEESTEQKGIPQTRSLARDIADAMKNKDGVAAKIVQDEEEKKKQEKEKSALSVKNAPFFVSGIIFIIIAIASIIYARQYIIKINATVPIEQTKTISSIIKSESENQLDLYNKTNIDIYNEINNTVSNENIRPGSIENISIKNGTSTQTTIKQFLDNIGSHAPDSIVNALSNDYMLGIYSYNNGSLFIILKGTQHDSLSIGMTSWELYLLEDMAPLFNIDIFGDNSYLTNVPFVPNVIENHDTRTLFNKDKKALLFYSFLDPNTIVISADSKTLTEINRRFNQQR